MKAGGRRSEAFYAKALLESRSTLHLSWRLAMRIGGLLDTHGRATAGAGLWHWALVLFILLDVVIWLHLRRTDRFGLGWRLPLDAADIAFWSLSPMPPIGHYDGAVLMGIPLAAEAGVRMGLRGLVVPFASLIGVGAIRVVADRPLLPFTFLWLVLGVGVGLALYSYCQRLHDEAEAERARLRAAEARRAYVAGQNTVAMGASSVVDAIEGVVPVLGRPEQGSALWQLAAGWKAELGRTTRSEAVYLQVALLEWERRYNRHPDLSSHVEVQLEEGAGTALLTERQAAWLHSWLDRQSPHGRLDVSLEHPEEAQRPPGSGLRIRVGGSLVAVPADRQVVQRPVDTGPVTFVLIAGQLLTLGAGGHVSWSTVAFLVAACLGTGYWSHRLLLARGRAARPSILLAAVGVAIVITVVGSSGALKAYMPDGNTVYIAVGLMLLAYLGGFYWHGSPPRLRVVWACGIALVAAASWGMNPAPATLRTFAATAIGALAPFPTAQRISLAIHRAGERYARDAREEDQAATLAAFRQGQETVIALVRQARDDACKQLERVLPKLDRPLASMVTQRLEEVDRRLQRIDDGGSSSSTTTS